MNVAYFGGAFDPIHKGHIELAVQVAKLFDQVWLVPCYGHVHGKNMMSAEDRWSMMCKAWSVIEANCDNIIISDFEIINEIKTLTIDDQVDALNFIKLELHKISPFKEQPVDCVLWVKNTTVHANDYNPNSVAPPEMKLLHISISEDGYTQPIVSMLEDDGNREVIDGFHRHRVGKEYSDVCDKV